MKPRIILVILFTLALSLAVEIVPATGQNIDFGLELGIGSTSLSYDDGPPVIGEIYIFEWDARPRVGYNIFAFIQVPITTSLSIQSGLRFSQLGDRASRKNNTFKLEKRQQYLSVPVRIRYYLFDGPVYVVAGPEFGYLIWAASTWPLLPPFPPDRQNNRFDGYLKRANVVLGVGIGAAFTLLGRRMYAQVYHNEGVTGNIRDIDGQRISIRGIGGYDWRTRETTLNIGYLFGN